MKDQDYFDTCYELIKERGMDIITTPNRFLYLMTPEGYLGKSDTDESITDLLVDKDMLFFLYPEHIPGLNDLMLGIEMAIDQSGLVRNYCYEEEKGGWQ